MDISIQVSIFMTVKMFFFILILNLFSFIQLVYSFEFVCVWLLYGSALFCVGDESTDAVVNDDNTLRGTCLSRVNILLLSLMLLD